MIDALSSSENFTGNLRPAIECRRDARTHVGKALSRSMNTTAKIAASPLANGLHADVIAAMDSFRANLTAGHIQPAPERPMSLTATATATVQPVIKAAAKPKGFTPG